MLLHVSPGVFEHCGVRCTALVLQELNPCTVPLSSRASSCLLRPAFPWCSLFAVWEKHSRLLRSSSIPHYLSDNAGNCPPPKAFCMTCFVCFALGLLSSGNKLALQGVFYLHECATSSPAVGPSCHQWDSSVWHPGWLPKEKNSSLISKPD